MSEFNKEDLDFHLPDKCKGLSKKYIMKCIFDKKIQSKWIPTIGDMIVGPTGNIFFIGNIDYLHDMLGGKRYFFGGGMCNRTGGNILNETHCYTMNESGDYYEWVKGSTVPVITNNPYHSSLKNFRFVPYPHEKERC